ncbi:cell division protein ZipA [Aurantivibrio plasticivorans]
MREWLTVIIVLLIVTVVLDGLRRMRNSRRSAIKMSLSMHQGTSKDDLDSYGSELPNGGARVVTVRKPDDAQETNHRVKSERQEKVSRTGRPYRIPEQVSLNLDEHVPMLMDSVAQEHEPEDNRAPNTEDVRIEPSFSAVDDEISDVDIIEPALSDDTPEQEEKKAKPKTTEKTAPPKSSSRSKVNDEQEDLFAQEESDPLPEPEDVLVLNVMSKNDQFFNGDDLLSVVLANGMRFGSMNIFHHHESASGEGKIYYSMANIVKPGVFDLNEMHNFRTPGVSLFMTLPNEGDSKKAFEAMLNTAQALSTELGGELKDENRSVMTSQTIEHYRSRIKEFERKQLSKAPA